MPAKVMVRRTDHTPGQLRELARKHRFRGCRHRLRAIALVMEDGLSRAAVASGAGVGARRRGPGGCARLPAGRGAGGAEGHAAGGVGAERDAPARRAGPPVRIRVPVPLRLPRHRRRGRACLRQGQHRGDGPAPPRHRGAGPRRKARPGGPRRGGPAPVEGPGDTGQRLPAPAAAHGPELNPGGTVFPPLKHRHLANRVSGSAEHVREVVEHVWDAFIGRKGEVTWITTREWAVP